MSESLVIIPTYNECENIEAISKAVFSQPHAFEILVVDDDSADGDDDDDVPTEAFRNRQ